MERIELGNCTNRQLVIGIHEGLRRKHAKRRGHRETHKHTHAQVNSHMHAHTHRDAHKQTDEYRTKIQILPQRTTKKVSKSPLREKPTNTYNQTNTQTNGTTKRNPKPPKGQTNKHLRRTLPTYNPFPAQEMTHPPSKKQTNKSKQNHIKNTKILNKYSLLQTQIDAHTHTHTHTQTYIAISITWDTPPHEGEREKKVKRLTGEEVANVVI